jgi:uncharacterized protein (TIGR02271 family)
MRWDRNDIRTGMTVMSTDGEKIGKVIRTGGETFVVEKGALFPKDYELRYDHIADLKGDSLFYALTEDLRREARSRTVAEPARFTGTTAAAATTTATAATTAAQTGINRAAAAAPVARTPAPATLERTTGEEVRIPLSQEEVDVEKVARETGHVRIHKTVKVEEKRYTVPVRREEVVIEHLAASDSSRAAAAATEATFEERVVDVPVHEEEIRVSKHPVLREEMVIRTVAHSIEKEATASLRHEEVEIEDTRQSARTDSTPSGFTTPGTTSTRR